MNCDPTGYFTIPEIINTQAIKEVLDKLHNNNTRMAIKILNAIATVYDTGAQMFEAAANGQSIKDIALTGIQSMIKGLLTGILLNTFCQLSATVKMAVRVGSLTKGLISQLDGITDALKEGRWDLFAARTIRLASTLFAITDTCFTGDTLVATEDGVKRIDEIEVSDKAWAYNVETGEFELKEVVTVFVKENREILHLEISNGEIISTTTNHPFYVIYKGWVAAGDLEIGDEVFGLDGSILYITGYKLEWSSTPTIVYNFEVADFHSYFVGEFGVLVHNNNYKAGDKTPDGYEFSEHSAQKANERNFSAENIDGIIRNGDYEYRDHDGAEIFTSSLNNVVILIGNSIRTVYSDRSGGKYKNW
jgi:hypothetical protein